MRTKSFILTFLMMMFCSIGFGQASHWGVPDTHCESTMTMITQIVVDGTIRGADVEIAAFCGDKLRGTVRPDETQMNMVYLVIHGNIPTAGDPAEVISFRFYDHSAGRELFYPYPDIVFEDNKKIGDIEFLNTQTGIYAGDNLIDFISIAEVNNVKYGILQEAVNAAQAGETVTLLQSATGAGVVIDKNITIDFGGKTYTVNQAVGSAGTETLGFQILKGKTVTLMNGTLTSTAAVEGSKQIKVLIQNYAHLTLSKMNLDDNTDHILYALSNNSGNVNLVGKTNITTDAVAFDVYDYSSAGYDVPTVNVNTTGIIDGKIEVSESISNNLNISGGLFTAQIAEAWCADGYIPTTEVIDETTYYTVKEGEYVARNTTTGQGYETLVEAVEAAQAGETVTLLDNATGAGLKINKDVTINFGGFTYTINQAVGSTGTESQGFQLLKNNTVTLKNGNIAIAENTNVKWMFNAYADVTLENLNVNCANMAAPAENEANYVLVVNNGGSATPTVTYTNVTVTNFPTATAQIWLDPTTTLKAGAGLESSIETGEGYVVVYNNGEYTAIGAVAKIGEAIYPSVAAAVAAAQAGDVIELLVNVTEDVTVNKSVTIDGKAEGATANSKYTGKIKISGNVNVTINEVAFVNGYVEHTSSNNTGTITVKYCSFANGGYAITTSRIKSVTIENCEVTNQSLLYAKLSTSDIVVKNVNISKGNYVAHIVYGSTAYFENVNATEMTGYGIQTQNYGAKTITINNCKFETPNYNSIAVRDDRTEAIDTFIFKGTNEMTSLKDTDKANYVLAEVDATLAAPEDYTVTTSVAGHIVDYADGKYYLRVPNYVAAIGETKYESLQAAIDAAQNGDEIDLIKGIYVTEVNNDNTTEILVSGGVSYRALYTVSGKSVTIDLNDNILYSTAVAADFMYNVFAVANGGHLTIKTDDLNGHGQVRNEAASSVYSLLFCYDGTLTIESGNYYLKNGESGCGMIYSQQDETVTVNGGKFILENVGTLSNGSPWIFNAKGQNTQNIIVNSGTFNDDILHQYYPFEVMAPKEKALQYNEGLWTMVDAVAYVDEQHKSGNYYTNEVGYATLEEAVAARKYNENADHVMTVTLLKEINLGNTTLLVDSDEDYKNSNINFDFAEKDVEGSLTPAIRIQGGANVTIKNGKMNTTGYNFILGASDGSSAGNLTIESGEYHAQTSVVSVTKGHLNITGGEFSVEPYQGNYAYLINCIDANYEDGSAKVSISGGTFHNWNPQNNAAEGAGTNFCADGYGAVETSANVWEVTPAQVITFETKWNWVSHYVEGNTGSDILTQLKNGLGAYGVQIKNQNDFTDYGTDPQGNTGWFGPLSNTSVTDMYKVNTSLASGETLPIQLTGAVVDPTQYPIEFAVNWNYIGYPLNESVNVETVFSGFAENGDYIKSRDQFAEYYDGMWWGDLKSMNPGEGYMYQRSTAGTFTYSYPATREAVKANVTSENNYWVPASSQYADNMTMVAMLDVKGGDYEVAAFVGGEVRGSARPVYIESLDAYMFFLTIHGEEVEEMTFKCYDLATGEEYDLNNRMNYSNDAVVGSIGNPYLLSRGATGIGESALTEVNIYPNPTTTGREVNLGSVCDTVEVFNALGVKIAEYTNVDTIDALETAGIYVIRITNDGNVQNCRLIVK